MPDCGVRTSTVPHSSQCTTSSGGADRSAAIAVRSSSSRHAPHRRSRRSAAPAPPRARRRSYSASRSAGRSATTASRSRLRPGLGRVDVGERGVAPLGDGCVVALRLVEGALGVLDVHADGLALLHDLELLVLEHALPAGEGLELVLQVGGLLGAHAGAREDLLVAVGPGADPLDVAFEAPDVAIQVARPGLHLHQRVLRRAHRRLGRGQLGVLGQGPPAVREPRELGVDVGEVQQASLGGGVGLHWGFLPIGCARPTVQGSVRRVDTRTSTLPPSAARRTSAACAHQGHSEAQWATSTSAGPPASEALRRRVVPQVRGDVGVDAGRGGRAQRGVARAPAHRDPADRPVGVARGPHPPGGRRQGGGDTVGEGVQRLRARAGCRSGPARAPTAGRRARGRRRRAPRRGARRAGRRRPRPAARAAAPSPASSPPPAPASRPRRSSGARRPAA